jgi:hypothetical protein
MSAEFRQINLLYTSSRDRIHRLTDSTSLNVLDFKLTKKESNSIGTPSKVLRSNLIIRLYLSNRLRYKSKIKLSFRLIRLGY